ncbi:ATP-dependent 5'-3' DNA helicase HCS1 [Cyberlindnera jadinii NRRL Y-1542]|uniref:DNA helicase n=1 Tax=Cyberlindnera jadinii (strain ATCC 18201 / CBS 1600 / BCRC 20928 / JCM 3617 / NBRC 0987 / NRRL Y-1542) TaxID=983966 RepID=A0A1E4S143_CYBJN|nr:DNA helicase [Cyberlindnera jadinii NRRL Y-1542]ODV73193.1 DNA helicase [Cyberlindnera jadinii NRRL Y-1542]
MTMLNKMLSENFLECISKEKSSDVEQTRLLIESLPEKKLALKGLAVINLTVDSIRTGLGGRTILELKNDMSTHDDGTIANGDIRTGDIVKVDVMGKAKKTKDESAKSDVSVDGVVTRVSQQSIVITVNEEYDDKVVNIVNDRIWIVKIANSITYKRMESTMRKLAELESLPPLFQLLLCESSYTRPSDTVLTQSLERLAFHDPNLNESQRFAINFALNSPISIIHGPPGTGKTYTLIETIRQLVDRGERVLVCGSSNISVDTILERLNGKLPGDQLLRIGHPARLLSANLQHCLDIVAATNDGGQLVNDIKKEIDDTTKKIKKTKSYREKKSIWNEVKMLKKELRERERKVTDELILQAKVVLCTLHGSSSRELLNVYSTHVGKKVFDTIIIDEVSQALEPQCWIPLVSHLKSNVHRLILAGDNQQLPPTIKIDTDDNVKRVLETTIFDRLVTHYGDAFKNLLEVQYRMNDKIMQFSSQTFYNSRLKADHSVHDILLYDLDNVEKTHETESPLIWYDTQGGEFPERDSSEQGELLNSSKFNEMEAYVVQFHINRLLEAGVKPSHIGVIAPYNAQVSLLKGMIHKDNPDIEISTVDGFQGREKEVIVLTLVRSNDKGEVGFLADKRRLNVAMTRPKRQLCVIGDMETISRGSKFLHDWTSWSEDNSDVIYPDLDDIL